MIPNNSRKLNVLEKSGLGCTVVSKPLFRLFRFLTLFVWYHIMTEWWTTVVWTTWNLDRMCAKYRYLKLIIRFYKKKFQIVFPKKNCFSKYFFSKIIFDPKCFCCCLDKYEVRSPLYTFLVIIHMLSFIYLEKYLI